jgi:hypothetical protein
LDSFEEFCALNSRFQQAQYHVPHGTNGQAGLWQVSESGA